MSGTSGNETFPYTLYALNFDTSNRTGTYFESTNFCFSCHSNKGSVQQVLNNDTSQTMGLSPQQGPTDILATFNQTSRHNLYDIWKFLESESGAFPWFAEKTNPCSACHDPHKARSSMRNPRDVNFSPLSRPSDHDNLWTQNMKTNFGAQYEPPFGSNLNNREPAASPSAEKARENMLDYVSLCTDCHNKKNILYSSTLERNLTQIDWSSTGDIHGDKKANGLLALMPPYQLNSKQNYILSCLDCHEPHGSTNTALLRRRVNGDELLDGIATPITTTPGTGEDTHNPDMGYLCMRCHQQDSDTGSNTMDPPQWNTVHHVLTDSPYLDPGVCDTCHTQNDGVNGAPLPIDCVNCHFHGSSDTWLQSEPSGRPTF